MNLPPVDADARWQATQPNASFCVSAPAGSGKTELLIQRFLALLARVDQPEHVAAITFTRKAAAEMRERVIAALLAAQAATEVSGAHEARTRELACAALQRDRQLEWGLLQSTGRLRMRTIDSFCADLTRQMPVLSQMGGAVEVVDDARELYLEAVENLFACLDEDRAETPDLEALLLHFDTRWERVTELLVGVLARRDQWRGYMGFHDAAADAEAYLRQVTGRLVTDALSDARMQLAPYLGELDELLAYRANLSDSATLMQVPGTQHADLAAWRELRRVLLTQGGDFRKTVTARDGFPAGRGHAGERRDAMIVLLAELSALPELRPALQLLDTLPDEQANPEGWQLLVHLSRVLPLLAACLLLVFQRHGKVDHVQTALAALDALGDDDAPTDVALRLDYTIEHLLVDEFQDTAINQYELVRRLTRGWCEHNAANPERPRTLMVVGDAMQSIYGFRDTNVSLFLRARDEGFGGLRLQPLQLTVNFRSDAGLVDWVNGIFVGAFPARDDPGQSQVSFTASSPVRPAAASAAVQAHLFAGDDARAREAVLLCERIQQLLHDHPGERVAVLGRTRRQLQPLLAALRSAQVDYAGQDIDSLSSTPVILDLLVLCRALANRYDRLSWMALLRAPWCGLLLADLLQLAKACDGQLPVQLLEERSWPRTVSPDGQRRLNRIAGALEHARQTRGRRSLRAWLEAVWLHLEGPACYPDPEAQRNAVRFFALLEQADVQGIGFDMEWLQAQVEGLYASSGSAQAPVQVMTLHKAKGLEFDHVVLTDLARQPRGAERELFRWDEHITGSGERAFLLAADDHSPPNSPGLYNYLGRERKRKAQLENTRLLYVGATRAIRSLTLTAIVQRDGKTGELKAPGANSLLAPVWDDIAALAVVHDYVDAATPDAQPHTAVRLLPRLASFAAAYTQPAPVPAGKLETAPDLGAELRNRRERAVGSAVHAVLEHLAQRRVLPTAPGSAEEQLATVLLREAGLAEAALETARSEVIGHIDRVLADDDCGRWILSSTHSDAACELPLRALEDTGEARELVIDRYFVDARTGERWLIDYKTSAPSADETFTEFCRREELAHRAQLERYRGALQALADGPVRCALYFTALARLHELALDCQGRAD